MRTATPRKQGCGFVAEQRGRSRARCLALGKAATHPPACPPPGCGGLGHGDKKTRLYPTLVDELAEEQRKIVQVSCGSTHTVALDSEGFVWSWGKGEYGRLGLGSSSDSSGPELVELLADLESVVQVAASGSFTLALTSTGQVYGWGKNDRACRLAGCWGSAP